MSAGTPSAGPTDQERQIQDTEDLCPDTLLCAGPTVLYKPSFRICVVLSIFSLLYNRLRAPNAYELGIGCMFLENVRVSKQERGDIANGQVNRVQ